MFRSVTHTIGLLKGFCVESTTLAYGSPVNIQENRSVLLQMICLKYARVRSVFITMYDKNTFIITRLISSYEIYDELSVVSLL